jgi:hypothetical protein
MNEDLIVKGPTLIEIISEIGPFGFYAVIISLLVLLVSPALFVIFKNKQKFTLWLMSQTIIGNLIIAPYVFIIGMIKSAQTMDGNFSKGFWFIDVFQLLPGCAALLTIALALFFVRFIVMTIEMSKTKGQNN